MFLSFPLLLDYFSDSFASPHAFSLVLYPSLPGARGRGSHLTGRKLWSVPSSPALTMGTTWMSLISLFLPSSCCFLFFRIPFFFFPAFPHRQTVGIFMFLPSLRAPGSTLPDLTRLSCLRRYYILAGPLFSLTIFAFFRPLSSLMRCWRWRCCTELLSYALTMFPLWLGQWFHFDNMIIPAL